MVVNSVGELFHSNIERPTLGMKLLVGYISRYEGFIEGFSMKSATRVVELMHLLPHLRDPHSKLLLFRS